MEVFPEDIFTEILIMMDLEEFLQFCATNKKYYHICQNEHYWKRLYLQFHINLKDKFPDLLCIKLVQILYKIQKAAVEPGFLKSVSLTLFFYNLIK